MPLPDYTEQVIKNVKNTEACVSLPPLIFWFPDILHDNKPTLLCNVVIARLL